MSYCRDIALEKINKESGYDLRMKILWGWIKMDYINYKEFLFLVEYINKLKIEDYKKSCSPEDYL